MPNIDNPNETAERVNGLNLSAASVTARDTIRRLTGDTDTEAINKALQAYAQILTAQHAGGANFTQERPGAPIVRVDFY